MAAPVVFNGYDATHTGFADVFALAPTALQDRLRNEVLSPMFTAESAPGDGRFIDVIIVGCADRQDAPGLTEQQRFDDEAAKSEARAADARQWLFDQLVALLAGAGRPIPADFTALQNVAIGVFPVGRGLLLHVVPASEAQRKENRRVLIFPNKFPKVGW
jgi:hypothetical protein